MSRRSLFLYLSGSARKSPTLLTCSSLFSFLPLPPSTPIAHRHHLSIDSRVQPAVLSFQFLQLCSQAHRRLDSMILKDV